MGPVYEIKRKLGDLFINSLHALHVQRAGVLDLAACDGVNHTSGTEFLGEFRVLWIILILWFIFGIKVVQVAKKLVETVIRGQMLIKITELILAELACHITHWLQKLRDRRVFFM